MKNHAPDARQAQRSAADPAREPAGLARRGCALCIDLAIAALVGTAVQGLMGQWTAPGSSNSALGEWIAANPRLGWSATFALPAWLALALLEALPGRAGVGKRALGLRLESTRGTAPPLAKIALRTAIKLVPWLVGAMAFLFPKPWEPTDALERSRLLILLGSNLWIGIYLASAAMTSRGQSLHDLATGTVVRSPAPRRIPSA